MRSDTCLRILGCCFLIFLAELGVETPNVDDISGEETSPRMNLRTEPVERDRGVVLRMIAS